MTNTQHAIAAAVAARGYTSGYTAEELLARQLVKLLEELCEAMACIQAPGANNLALVGLVRWASAMGAQARAVFDAPSLFSGVRVDAGALTAELPDLTVPLAVMAEALSVSLLDAALAKAQSDIARGVRHVRS